MNGSSFKILTLNLSQPEREVCLRLQEQFEVTLIDQQTEPYQADSLAAVILGSEYKEGHNQVSQCLKLKSSADLALLPLIALLAAKERKSLEALYGSGADFVLTSPGDSVQIHAQLLAIKRMQRGYREALAKQAEESETAFALLNALRASREGILVLNDSGQLVIANYVAKVLLGVFEQRSHSSKLDLLDAVIPQFQKLILAHLNSLSAEVGSSSKISNRSDGEPLSSYHDLTLTRLDRRSFKAQVRATSIEIKTTEQKREFEKVIQKIGVQNEIPYSDQSTKVRSNKLYVFYLRDIALDIHIKKLLQQSARTRGLALMGLSLSRRLFPNNSLGLPTMPLSNVQKLIESEPRRSFLNDSLSVLLDILDLILESNISLRVQSERDFILALRSSDLIQLLGELIFLASDHCASGGEIRIETDQSESDPLMARLIVTARSERANPYFVEESLAQLLESYLSPDNSNKKLDNTKLASTLQAIELICARYGTQLESKQSSQFERSFRIKLPCC